MNSTRFVAVVYTGSGVVLGAYPGENEGEASGAALRQWQVEQLKWQSAGAGRPETPPFWELYVAQRNSPVVQPWTVVPQ